MLKFIYTLLISFLFLTQHIQAIEESKIPSALIEWKDWVLDDVKDRECPIDYKTGETKCTWYRDIRMHQSEKKLDFNMSVILYKNQSKVTLPSAHLAWVKDVKINGEKAIVLDFNSKPLVILDKGIYNISGSIPWNKNLKSVVLPPSVALVNLYKDSEKVSNFLLDSNARLWLDKTSTSSAEKGSLSVSLYRKVIDGHPIKMQTYLHFSVSGKMRSVTLDGVLLDTFLPTAIQGSLDATITKDNKLKVEVKAGEWEIILDSYTPQNISILQKPKHTFVYDNQEVWSLQKNPYYRTIDIKGVTAIDPSQSNMPQNWRNLPAFLIEDKPFEIKELYKSTKQQQKNEFVLKRQIWLDFDGKGYTISDNIKAQISEVRRLEASNVLDLASVSINGKATLITTVNNNPQKGVELRKEHLNIQAFSRVEGNISMPPVNGWGEKFDSAQMTLNLPVGWKLFASFGSDRETFSWVDKWDLMDIFLVLLLSIGIYQLFGWRWSVLATLFIILLWHENDAPTLIWLILLALLALLRVLNEGKIKKLMKFLMFIVVGVAILQVLSFTVHEIRTALHPQLEKKFHTGFGSSAYDSTVTSSKDYIGKKMSAPRLQTSEVMAEAPRKKVNKLESQIMQNRINPNAIVQTGIAKPKWTWITHNFYWQSAIASEQRLELWLISPMISKVLKILHIIGMFFLLYMFLREFIQSMIPKLKKHSSLFGGAKALSFMLVFLLLPPHTLRADIPSDTLLQELKSKLTTAPTCLPHCVGIESVELGIVDNILEINMDISAKENVSLPIFGNRNIWMPSTVTIDGKAANLNTDKSGKLWIVLSKGSHKIQLRGNILGQEQIILSSVLPLRNIKNLSTDTAWQVSSNNKSYIEINNLKEQKKKNSEKSKIEPLINVERTLYFGQRWYIDTRVWLENRIDKPHTLLYSLLPNESILNKEIEEKNGKVLLHLDNKNRQYRWRSSIPITENLELHYPKNSTHLESWQMDIASIWAMDYEGLEPIEQRSAATLMPRFKPWRGDKLKLTMQKTKAVKGKSLSIESSTVNIVQSERFRDVTLILGLKSSKAGQYSINIANIEELKPTIIDGNNHYLKISNSKVSIPLQAKSHNIRLSWREEKGNTQKYAFPQINLNQESVNSTIKLTLPYNRWVLWTNGPTMGPAVLLWGVLLAMLLFSLILGKIKGTPLKTRDWLLLGLGVSTTSVYIMLPVVLWIFALRFREQKASTLTGWYRNFTQIGLVILTFIALVTIIGAISAGLLGNPDMMIAGNNSYAHNLNWYSDRISGTMAEPTVISVSIWFYRALMLLWAVWIAFSLIKWLKWAWEVFSQGDMWAKGEKKEKKEVKK